MEVREVKIKILGESVELSEDFLPIGGLKFLKDNPRVYAVTHAEKGFEELTDEEQQDLIFQKLQDEPSFKNLLPEVKRHGSLLEPVLVRMDTMEVIEGNSRLAVYRYLHKQQPDAEWDLIPCYLVARLTVRQQAAFLNQIHVKGKTQWSAYEKANFAYVRKMNGMNLDDIADLFGESPGTIRTRIKTISLMKEEEDGDQDHFSHYDVCVRVSKIWNEIKDPGPIRNRVICQIKSVTNDEGITAQDLRKKLPVIIKKPSVLKKFADGKIDLDEGYQRAKVSRAEERVKQARALLEEIELEDISSLDPNSLNSLRQAVKKLARVVTRIDEMIAKEKSK